MLELLSFPFVQRALVAGVLVGLAASYYGVFIVQRGLGFMGHGLAHAAFGGVALGLLLGAEPVWIAAPFTVAVAVGITWVRDRTRLGADSVIGIFIATAMALGVIFISLRKGYAADAFTYLFGSILAVAPIDLAATGVLFLLTIATLPLWGRWAYATIDREAALIDRVPAGRDDYLLSSLIAVTIVVAVKVVGILLISAFLVIPAATARLLVRSFITMTMVSLALGAASVLAGMTASLWLDIPSGAAIILVQAGLFVGAMAIAKVRER